MQSQRVPYRSECLWPITKISGVLSGHHCDHTHFKKYKLIWTFYKKNLKNTQENVHSLKHLVFQVTPACSPLPFTRESLPPLPLPRPPLAPRPPLNPPIPSGFGVAFLTSTWWQLKEQTENTTANHATISQGNLAVKTTTRRATRWKHKKDLQHTHCNVSSLLPWTDTIFCSFKNGGSLSQENQYLHKLKSILSYLYNTNFMRKDV